LSRVHSASAAGRWFTVGLLLLHAKPCLASWASDGDRVVSAASIPASLSLVAAPGGNVQMAWLDGRTGYNTDVRATLWTTRGNAAPGWTLDGDLVTNCTCRKYEMAAASDGSGGALYAWSDNRCTGYRQIYAIRVLPASATAAGWIANGVQLAPTVANQFVPSITGDGAGGAFIAWQDQRGADADVYLQHVDASGARVAGWPAAGLGVATGAGAQTAPVVAADGSGGVLVAWQQPGASGDDVYLQRIGPGGVRAAGWAVSGNAVCTAPGDQHVAGAVPDGAGGVLLAWLDQRSGHWDVYASRVGGDGALAPGWVPGGTAACTAGGESALRAASDGSNGLLLAWEDHRGPDADVYGMHLTGAGAPAAGWLANGSALCAVAGDQSAPDLAADGAGGAFVVWQDRRAVDADIRALHIAGDGTRVAGWPVSGALVCGATGDQTAPRVAVSGADGYVAWLDRRVDPSADELFAQRLLAQGPMPVQPIGLTALHHDGQTFITWTPPPDTGWTHRIYYRASPITSEADLSASFLVATVGDSSAVDHRFHALTGTVATFRTDSTAAPLPVDAGLFVLTVPAGRKSYYAVTSQLRGGPEDRRIVPGANSLISSVTESAGTPRPVYQRPYALGIHTADIYTLWTWNQDVPFFPAMSNRAGWPFDCGVTHGAPLGPAFVRPHQRGGSFLEQLEATGAADEWVLGLDDYTLNQDVQTYWYGYHPDYDFRSDANVPPVSGTVIDYTNRRVLYTIAWWRRTFGFDLTRHYAFGYSLGGTYSMHLALARPDLIVAAMSSVGKVDFSFEADPVAESAFNPGKPYRQALSRLWGTTASALESSEGRPVYSVMNDDALAAASGPDASFIMNFAGRHDIVVGWAEKLPFYAAMEAAHLGGTQFWDNRDHYGTEWPGALAPMLDLRYLLRFHSDRSWPAFSHCSADGAPGAGTLASGDSVGTLNGYMEWDPLVTDTPSDWAVTLSTRPLNTLWGVLPAPESLTVDVTPRRTQRFVTAPGRLARWTAARLADGAVVQRDSVLADALGLVTIPAVRTYRTGTRLTISIAGGVAGVPAGPPRLALAPVPTPVRSAFALRGSWPEAGEARVELFDASGRRVVEIWRGIASAGPWQRRAELSQEPPGLYWLRAEQNGAAVVRRLVLLQ